MGIVQVGALRVEAEANTDDQPMPGFVPRKSPGLPVFGKSSTEPPDSKVWCPNSR